MKKKTNTKGTHGLIHNPGYDFKRLVYWMNQTDINNKNIHIAPYFIPVLALLGVCFSIEGYINMVGQKIDKDWKNFDKGPTPFKDRLKRIYLKLNKQLDCSKGVWQQILQLFKIRIKLVHPQYVEKTDVRHEHDEIQNIFQIVEAKYPPKVSKEVLQKAIDTLLKDANLTKVKELCGERTYCE